MPGAYHDPDDAARSGMPCWSSPLIPDKNVIPKSNRESGIGRLGFDTAQLSIGILRGSGEYLLYTQSQPRRFFTG